MKSLRRCIPYAVILSNRGTTSRPLEVPLTSKAMTTSAASTIIEGMDTEMNDAPTIGGGAINEKQRLYQQEKNNQDKDESMEDKDNNGSWNPSDSLSHMMHALVGLDRYPNYLSRFKDEHDMELLERALESRLIDVKRKRKEIHERRAGIEQLVKRYIINMNENSTQRGNDKIEEAGDCSSLWNSHPLLSAPNTWPDLQARNILQDQAFKVAYQSISKALQNNRRKAKSNKSQKQSPEISKGIAALDDIIRGSAPPIDLDPALLEDWMSQEMYDVYSIPLLTSEFCGLLRTTLRELAKLAETEEFAHLNLGRRVIDLDTIGLGWITDLLFHMFIQPISSHLFAATEQLDGGSSDRDGKRGAESSPLLDWRQGYVAGYSADPTGRKAATRHRLVPHTDDSEVTLNCCLGEETFEGGSVEFYGLRGTPEEGQLVGKVNRPDVGTALLHSGRNLHAVSDVLAGDRYAFIVWCRSWSRLRSRSCPCCWLNRRQDSTCICNRRWN